MKSLASEPGLTAEYPAVVWQDLENLKHKFLWRKPSLPEAVHATEFKKEKQ